MSNPLDKHRFARALRAAPNPEAAKRITEHFEAQRDLRTQCQRCRAQLKGTMDELKAHVCPDVAALI